ncbi:MAG: DUF4230 domain-containing protein [Thermoanaerobaculia bacterium]
MRGFARILPWFLALFFAAVSGFLVVRLATSVRETQRADAAPVVSAIRKIAHLATVEVQISDVLRFEEIKSFLIFDFPKSATIRMRGKVIAGFDLSSPEFQVQPDPGKRLLRVTLPAPRILALDPRLEWFDEQSGLFNPITPQDRTRWMLWARGQLGRAAKDSGIEARAVEHARDLLTGAAAAFGWKVEVGSGLHSSDFRSTPLIPRG